MFLKDFQIHDIVLQRSPNKIKPSGNSSLTPITLKAIVKISPSTRFTSFSLYKTVKRLTRKLRITLVLLQAETFDELNQK